MQILFISWLALIAFAQIGPQGGNSPFPCFKHHGRLVSQNGASTIRIWLIGTRRIVGILDGDLPEPIKQLQHPYLEMTSPENSYIFGDFTICPEEPDIPGHMRHVKLTAAERLVIQDIEWRRPAFKVKSTWPREAGKSIE